MDKLLTEALDQFQNKNKINLELERDSYSIAREQEIYQKLLND